MVIKKYIRTIYINPTKFSLKIEISEETRANQEYHKSCFFIREKEYSSAEKLHFSLLGVLNEREQLPKNSQAHGRLSFQLRQSLNQLYSEIQSLRAHLERLSQNKLLYVDFLQVLTSQ